MSAPQDITREEVDRRFTYPPPTNPAVREAHDAAQNRFKWLAHALREELPPGREKALALTALEEASFWCHAAIARNHDQEDPNG